MIRGGERPQQSIMLQNPPTEAFIFSKETNLCCSEFSADSGESLVPTWRSATLGLTATFEWLAILQAFLIQKNSVSIHGYNMVPFAILFILVFRGQLCNSASAFHKKWGLLPPLLCNSRLCF